MTRMFVVLTLLIVHGAAFASDKITSIERDPIVHNGVVKSVGLSSTYLVSDAGAIRAALRENMDSEDVVRHSLVVLNSKSIEVGSIGITFEEFEMLKLAGKMDCPYQAEIRRDLSAFSINLDCDVMD